MPSKSFRQARMMAGAAHDPVFARKVGVPQKTAKEFNKADERSGFLGAAARAKGSGVMKKAKGGEVSPKEFMNSWKNWKKNKEKVEKTIPGIEEKRKGGMVDRAAVRGHTKGKIY